MKRGAIAFALAAVAGCVTAPEWTSTLTVDDVLRMNAAGVAPDVTVAHIRANRVAPLDTERIIALSRDPKLDAKILRALVESGGCPRCREIGIEP